MDRQALERTLSGPHATFWSRSRGELWTKGQTSGNVQRVVAVAADCDADTLLVSVDPQGPACHTGAPTCFFETISPCDAPPRLGDALAEIAGTIEARRCADPDSSWTARLLSAGVAAYGAKIVEEADEVVRACAGETEDRVAEEAADLLYHLLVGLADRNVSLAAVARVLTARAGVSGLEAKALRDHSREPP